MTFFTKRFKKFMRKNKINLIRRREKNKNEPKKNTIICYGSKKMRYLKSKCL